MNYDEELDALYGLAVDNSLPVFDAIITCACKSTIAGISDYSLHELKAREAKEQEAP